MSISDPTSTNRHRIGGLIAAAGVTGVLSVPSVADAAQLSSAPSAETDHCVVDVVGQESSGEYELGEQRCFGTLAEALASAGADVDPSRAISMRDVAAEGLVETASVSLAVHYDGFNRTGASITVSGVDCGGGYVNLSASWVNRVSSTYNLCPVVRFWDGYDKTGAHQDTSTGQHDLTSLNNASNSIQYAS